MKKFRIFIVNDDTWVEHSKVGIAAINDPLTKDPSNNRLKAPRQEAIAEISGIRPGDVLFFNRMVSHRHSPELLGVFEASSSPYYDPNPLFPGAKYVNERLPFRVEFECINNFQNPINIDEIWALREKGKIWTLQQSRGDAVGVHACVGITKIEAKYIERLLKANNLIEGKKIEYERQEIKKIPLPIDFRTGKVGQLHYEATLKGLILEDLANGKHEDVFGNYDDFIPNVPTGSRKEIDILLLKYNGIDIVWYQILELKSRGFTMKELQRLIDYEKWIKRSRSENPLQVHPVALAGEFNDEVLNFVKRREDYQERPIRLIKYTFDENRKTISLREI